MRRAVYRVAATEYVASRDVLATLRAAGFDAEHALAELARTSSTLRRALHLESTDSPISIDPQTSKVTIANLAGVVRLAPNVELDLAPKFLGHDYAGWREDFLTIANVTGEGRILSNRPVSGSYGETSDLASLIGRVFVDEFWSNQRSPLHVYRPRRWRSFTLDGDLDFEDVPLVIDEDGIPQTAVVLDLRNEFTATMRAAAQLLTSVVLDPGVRAQLTRVVAVLPSGAMVPRELPALPARHRRWAPLVELSQRVLAGFDVTLRDIGVMAPGFIVRTWQAWERLIYVALRSRHGARNVGFQTPVVFGKRHLGTGAFEDVLVRPDVSVTANNARRLYDGKYKTHLRNRRTRIVGTDLQEANAFMDAAGATAVTLLYPRVPEAGVPADPPGSCRVFDRVSLAADKTVLGVDVEVRGIGRRGGFRDFASTLTSALDALASPLPSGA